MATDRLGVDTIRFYEKLTLIPAPGRIQGDYRGYAEQDIDRLEFIGRAQNLDSLRRRSAN